MSEAGRRSGNPVALGTRAGSVLRIRSFPWQSWHVAWCIADLLLARRLTSGGGIPADTGTLRN